MNYSIETTKQFEDIFKRLSKKYRSLIDDLEKLKNELLANPEMGDDLGGNTRKVRMAVASKNKGKRSGARIITCTVLVSVEDAEIYLLTIYDKSEQDSILKEEITHLKEINGLV